MGRAHESTGSWADAYLAAFAQQNDYEFIFDRGFARWRTLEVEFLSKGSV